MQDHKGEKERKKSRVFTPRQTPFKNSCNCIIHHRVVECMLPLLNLLYTQLRLDRHSNDMSDGHRLSVHLTNRFHLAVCLFSNRSQVTSKCGKNKTVAHKLQASVSLMFLPCTL